MKPLTRAEIAVERRIEWLAEKYGLSMSLTQAWVRENPHAARRPMNAANLAKLKAWAKLPASHYED